ncbi:MAG: diacylglycerol kinase [Alicyclobacillaceae bacterium]|nr:diacylglycerol kinase [Alicyclobacillaceae bacterium]
MNVGRRPAPDEWQPLRPRPSLLASFGYALDGLAYALRMERNMRIHFALAGVVFFFELVVRPPLAAALATVAAACAVIAAEAVNTALERVADVFSEGQAHPAARAVKDAAAGAVLAVAAAAAAVGAYVVVETYPWQFRLFSGEHPFAAGVCGGGLAGLLFVLAWSRLAPRAARGQSPQGQGGDSG